METAKVRAEVTYGADKYERPEGMENMDPWTVQLRYRGRRMTTPFYTGFGLRDHGSGEPTAASVMECLLSDAASVDHAPSFDEWASDLGWDPDSRRAERCFKTVVRQSARVRQLLGDDYEAAIRDPDEWVREHCEDQGD